MRQERPADGFALRPSCLKPPLPPVPLAPNTPSDLTVTYKIGKRRPVAFSEKHSVWLEVAGINGDGWEGCFEARKTC